MPEMSSAVADLGRRVRRALGAVIPGLGRAEGRARAAEARLQALVDALPEGVVLLDAEGRYVLWNRRYSEIYARSADLFAPGRRLMETLRIGVERGDYPEAVGREEDWLADRERALNNPGERREQQIANGTWLMIEERRTPDGGTVGLRVDITQMKRQARQIEQAAAGRAEVMADLAQGLSHLSAGDLTYRFERPFAPEYEPLRGDFNKAVGSLAEAVSGITHLTDAVVASATEISSAADDLSLRTERQAVSLEETAAALDQVTSGVQETAKRAVQTRAAASEAFEVSARSSEVVREAVMAMDAIQASSGQIGGVTEVIEALALQTKLLSLNASIEAARAGEAGRGFAVIAQEVRALAEKSAQAAKEIKELIGASGSHVQHGAALVARTGEAFRTVIDKVSEINALADDMATSTQDQAANLQHVNQSVIGMDRITQQNAVMVEETSTETRNLASEAMRLRAQLARFRASPTDSPASAEVPRIRAVGASFG